MIQRTALFLDIKMSGKKVDIGEDDKIVLRNENDLKKIDKFWELKLNREI